MTYRYTPIAPSLVPIATTAPYTASVNDWVIVDCSSASVAITLPTAPANLSTVAVKRYDAAYASANIATIVPGGSDAFLGGSTTPAQLLLQGQTLILQYNSTTAQWGVRSTDEPLSQLDSRYLNQSTTGNAATATKLAAPANINGVGFDGSAPIAVPALGAFAPTDYGYIAWSGDPIKSYGITTTLVAGEAYLTLLPIRQAVTITNVIFAINTAGATLTSGQNFAGLFDFSGNLLSATADQSTAWQSAGVKVMALTVAQSVAAGLYYVGWFSTGTTLPKLFYDASANGSVGAANLISSHPRAVIDATHTGLTTAFHTPVTLTSSATPFWAAVS
jgi:hypothetical protein